MNCNDDRKDYGIEEEEDDDEEVEVMEIRGVVMKLGIKWSVVWEWYVVDVYMGIEIY